MEDFRMARLLIAEPQPELSKLFAEHFPVQPEIETASSLEHVRAKLSTAGYDAVIWNIGKLDSRNSKTLDLLETTSSNSPETRIFLITPDDNDPLRGRITTGNYHYIRAPIDGRKLCAFLSQAFFRAPRDGASLYPEIRVPTDFDGILGVGLAMREVTRQIGEAAATDISVLVTGETGTGKDLVAAAIHKRSARKDFLYVPVNTGAISRELIAAELFGHEKGSYTGAIAARQGLFEQANRGTIFLDEISTMDEKTQISLLRVLEAKTFRRVGGEKEIQTDVRVIAATNEDIEKAVKEKRFREDLYYRLDVFHIHVPPLRNRPGAVTFLTDHFVNCFGALYEKDIGAVSPEAYRYLRRYPWPGNVRELKNVIQRAVLLAARGEISPYCLPARIREAAESNANPEAPFRPGMTLQAVEKEFIKMTLVATRGNKKAAGVMLGISRRALYNKLKRFGLL
jgi:DNA-binding NtrC family response regulator